jgi:hypothetical protein
VHSVGLVLKEHVHYWLHPDIAGLALLPCSHEYREIDCLPALFCPVQRTQGFANTKPAKVKVESIVS